MFVIAIITSHKINFKALSIIRGKEGYSIMIKASIHRIYNNSIIIYQNYAAKLYAAIYIASKYLKQKLTELSGEMNKSTYF